MFERFTDRARRVVVLAQEESRHLNHGYIGTEHLLLGLLAERDGIAAQALGDLGVAHDEARARVEEMVGVGESPPEERHIPLEDAAKTALEMSLREAIRLGHDHIGTEHILLGLLTMSDSVGSRALESMGVELEQARQRVVEMLGDSAERIVMEPAWTPPERKARGKLLTRHEEPALASLLFVLVALVAVQIVPPTAETARWGLALLLGGVLLWAGGSVIGTGPASGARARGMGRSLRLLGGLTMAAAASLFVLGALLG